LSQHDELMDAIRQDPDDQGAWAVLQDWLLAHDDPRAQPIEHLAQNAERWFGQPAKVAGDLVILEKPGEDSYAPHLELTFARGHVKHLLVATNWDGVRDDWCQDWMYPMLARILSQPVGQLVLEMEIRATPNPDFLYEGLIEAITAHGPLAVRKIYVGDDDQLSWTMVPDCRSLWAAAPWLEHAKLQGSAIELGAPSHERLRELFLVSGGLPTEPVHALAAARLPALRTLDVWFGSRDYGAQCDVTDVLPLLGRDLPSLRQMGLRNCEFSDALVPQILKARWLPGLEELWLDGSVLTDKAGEALLAGVSSLRHLKRLDVSECYLSAEMVGRLSAALGDALEASGQRAPSVWGGASHYYVNVGE
jgi:uncharacterized protein (TIGR02996 family)